MCVSAMGCVRLTAEGDELVQSRFAQLHLNKPRVVGDEIGIGGLVLADKPLKPMPRLSRIPTHQPVASYCGEAAPGGWDVGTPSLLYCQGPQFTGGGAATQFCLIGQLEGGWAAVWERKHGLDVRSLRGRLLVERSRGRRVELPGLGGR